jgi:hypothetical protein
MMEKKFYYVSPQLEVIEVEVDQGFASNVEAPVYGEEEWQ